MATSAARAARSKSRRETIAELVKPVPWIGPILAWLIINIGIGAAILTIVLLIVFPLTYPLLMAYMLHLLPEKARMAYAEMVLESFQGVMEKDIDETVGRIIRDNNTRLDFVQQFSLAWQPGVSRSPPYSFPLMTGQEFDLEFSSVTVPNSVPCKGDKAVRAEEAVRNKKLFTIWALGKDRLSTSVSERQRVPFGEKFWQTATSEIDLLNGDHGGGIATARVEIDQSLAKEINQCFQLTSTLDVVVRKTIKASKRTNIASNSISGPNP
ncbi:hypothetical protein [Roseateles chitinivorans]|uniref:hypothetical protein n=1 Tax=Roseateles chitinivorans TaxID=2917965 RepID=UPI003D66DBFC